MTIAPPQPDAVLACMACLADATRVRLLRLLERDELGVSDLCAVVQMPQSTVSRHLKVLASEGWVTHRRQATTRLYRMIADELTPTQRDLWTLTRQHAADWPTLRQDAARLTARLASGTGKRRAFFAGLAESWDATRDATYGPNLNALVLGSLLPSGVTSFADFGCGTGSLLLAAAPHLEQAHGLDASPEMLTAAKSRANSHELPNIGFHETELADTPLETHSLDAIACVLVLSYLEPDDRAAVLAEMRRVVKPRGVAIVLDLLAHDRDHFRREMGQTTNGFAPKQLVTLLGDAGFAKTQTHQPPPHPDATGPALLVARAC
ncbi:MAG: metalloregulator ArsR/SmtB family transcription factor [Planctomycetota bacterium]